MSAGETEHERPVTEGFGNGAVSAEAARGPESSQDAAHVADGHAAMMDVICPMHAILDSAGRIAHAGPTLYKLFADQPFIGVRFAELFEIKRPRVDGSMRALMDAAGSKMHLRMRGGSRTDLKGVLVPLAPGTGPEGGALVNLSFGISVVGAVREFGLTGSDFAPTDLAVEMLYLVEAKNAAMEASRTLNQRLQGAMIAAEEQAYTDTLTGLRNRRALDYVLDRLSEAEEDFALIHLDLDFFKAVNDTGGHPAGDHVLCEVARILTEETRGDDTVARVGGDEFVLALIRLIDPVKVHDIVSRVIARLERPIAFEGRTYRISASAGSVLSCQYPTPDIPLMMAEADAALYEAKHRGRGCHVAFTKEKKGA